MTLYQVDAFNNKIFKRNPAAVVPLEKWISGDFVLHFFSSKIGINEDPVTGSAHTLLIPYWSKKLNKPKYCSAFKRIRNFKLHLFK